MSFKYEHLAFIFSSLDLQIPIGSQYVSFRTINTLQKISAAYIKKKKKEVYNKVYLFMTFQTKLLMQIRYELLILLLKVFTTLLIVSQLRLSLIYVESDTLIYTHTHSIQLCILLLSVWCYFCAVT